MKLLLLLYSAIFFTSCALSKAIMKQSITTEVPSVTITVLFDNNYNQSNLNDVLSALGNVKPFKTFSVNQITGEATEVKIVYADLNAEQKDEIYHELYCLGVKVVKISGY